MAQSVVQSLKYEQHYTTIQAELFERLGEDIILPDGGYGVKFLADTCPGGAFDPRDLEKIPPQSLGYRAKWMVVRYNYYGLDWDITGLRLESCDPNASALPWVVIIHGGNTNFYEFFMDPLHNPGLGQYLAQKMNVLLITVPGYFKYNGWTESVSAREPQYLLDRVINPEEIKARNAIYTFRMELEGVKRLVLGATGDSVLLVGHSTGGDLAFLAMEDRELACRLKGRFLGWASGGPSNLRKEWEERVGIRETQVKITSGYPPLWQLRFSGASEHIEPGYVGPLHPCAAPGISEREVAHRWLSSVGRYMANFRQIMQDMEHRGMVELKPKIQNQIEEALSSAKLAVNIEDVLKDTFATNYSPLTGYRKMVWMVGKWDKGHWNRNHFENSRELIIANQFRERNPDADIRILLFDLSMTHYGHIERPRQLAGGLLAATRWIIT